MARNKPTPTEAHATWLTEGVDIPRDLIVHPAGQCNVCDAIREADEAKAAVDAELTRRSLEAEQRWARGDYDAQAADIARVYGGQIDKGETRIVDAVTGGEKGSKLARFDLIPPSALWALAEHYGRGAQKYADNNWRRGYSWGLSYAALCRHLVAFWDGEDIDPETGSHHLTAVAWHAFTLFTFRVDGLGTDDRASYRASVVDERP